MQELLFLHSARRLMLIDICMKFREDSLRRFQVTEQTRFVTDRRPGKNNTFPNPEGGDIINEFAENINKYSASFNFRKKSFQIMIEIDFFLVRVEALRPSQQFFSHVGTFSWVEPVLSNEDEVSCSRTQHRAPCEIQTRDLVIKSLILYQLS